MSFVHLFFSFSSYPFPSYLLYCNVNASHFESWLCVLSTTLKKISNWAWHHLDLLGRAVVLFIQRLYDIFDFERF